MFYIIELILTFIEGSGFVSKAEFDGVGAQEFSSSVKKCAVNSSFPRFRFSGQRCFDIFEGPGIVSTTEKNKKELRHLFQNVAPMKYKSRTKKISSNFRFLLTILTIFLINIKIKNSTSRQTRSIKL